jgi:hypothetical protein
MSQQGIMPFGTAQVTLAVGQSLAVQSKGKMTILKRVAFPNYPGSFVIEAEGDDTELSVGPYAGVTTLEVTAGAWPAIYNVGTRVAAETFGGANPTLNSVVYFDHFTTFDTNEWTITTTEAGSSSATEAIGTEAGGWLVITNDNADDDNDFLQLKGESFKFVAGKKLWFEARIKTNDATESDIVLGLQITDTTPLDVTDGVFFIKADGSAAMSFVVEKNNTATTTASVATLANDTAIILGFYYDGAGVLEYRVNRDAVGTVALTNLPDDEELTVSFGIQNGAAAVKSLSIDYIRVEQEA